jgi:hypothetical protein
MTIVPCCAPPCSAISTALHWDIIAQTTPDRAYRPCDARPRAGEAEQLVAAAGTQYASSAAFRPTPVRVIDAGLNTRRALRRARCT